MFTIAIFCPPAKNLNLYALAHPTTTSHFLYYFNALGISKINEKNLIVFLIP